MRYCGCKSRDTLYARIKAGKFPAPLPNPDGNRPNVWRKSAIAAHQRAEFARLEALAKKTEQAAA
jgi:hypothetical protein